MEKMFLQPKAGSRVELKIFSFPLCINYVRFNVEYMQGLHKIFPRITACVHDMEVFPLLTLLIGSLSLRQKLLLVTE